VKNLAEVEVQRIKANELLDPKKRSALGQYFTPIAIGQFMASLFSEMKGEIKLLEPGCGVGSLIAPFVSEALKRNTCTSINITAYEIETAILKLTKQTLSVSEQTAKENKVALNWQVLNTDFILANDNSNTLFSQVDEFTHVITNPPYKKISSVSNHRKALSNLKIETVNLYSGFVALSLQLLKPLGELVAIIPRSFCNG
jgi:adenine-specific DNA-methyltransferase